MNVPSSVSEANLSLGWSPGEVTIKFPELFALTAHAQTRRFVERILQVDEVTSVFVQFGRGTAVVRFDELRVTVSQMLEKMARVLHNRSTSASGADYVSIALERERSQRKATQFRPIRDAWEVLAGQAGEFFVRSPLLEVEPHLAETLAKRLAETTCEASTRVGTAGHCLRIEGVSHELGAGEIRGLLDHAVEQAIEQYWVGLQKTTQSRVVTGSRRLIYVGLTLASFGMMVVAFILPGIPTPPFLVSTTYFGVRSSPRFYRWLSRTWLFGRMVRDWRDHRAFRLEDKLKSILLTLALIVVGIVWLGVRGPLLIVVLSIAAVEIVWLLSIPEIVVPGRRQAGPARRLAVAAAT